MHYNASLRGVGGGEACLIQFLCKTKQDIT